MSTDVKKMVRGELTAFLSLVFLLLLSLVGAVLESASIQVMKNERRADAGRAMESVFAEYQREFLEEYEIFAIDGSYETEVFSESNILNRLSYYGAENIDMEISEVRYLTDEDGKAFYEQAVQYEKEKTGMDALTDVLEEVGIWKDHAYDYGKCESEDYETRTKLNQLLQESEQKLPDEENPIEAVSNLKSKSIWELVLSEEFQISEKAISKDQVVSNRELQEGNWSETEDTSGGTIFFNLYLMEHFGNALNQKENTVLSYELEYLLSGKSSDKANLESTLTKICSFRFGVNYLYLLSDSEKQAEARAMAATLCTLLTVPGITEVTAHAILLAWAYGEAVMDVKTLVSGGKVKLLKDKSNWNLSLEKLASWNSTTEIQKSEDDKNGLDYKTYLQIMLYMKEKTMLRMRALDLIELNLEQNLPFLQVDQCVTGLKVESTCRLRRGINYQFVTKYHYQ